MAELSDLLRQTAQNEISRRGLRVQVKTELGPAFTLYDSDKPGGGQLAAGVIVTDRNGEKLAEYGGWPKTNYLKAGAVAAFILGMSFLVVRGVVR